MFSLTQITLLFGNIESWLVLHWVNCKSLEWVGSSGDIMKMQILLIPCHNMQPHTLKRVLLFCLYWAEGRRDGWHFGESTKTEESFISHKRMGPSLLQVNSCTIWMIRRKAWSRVLCLECRYAITLLAFLNISNLIHGVAPLKHVDSRNALRIDFTMNIMCLKLY